jgi:hypothetical protein
MATFEVTFDNERQGAAGVWRPKLDGEDVVLDERVLVEESDERLTVVHFETTDAPRPVRAMAAALAANPEVVEWSLIDADKHVIAVLPLSNSVPSQTPCPPSGMAYTQGDELVVFFDPRSDTYGYCFAGVGVGGDAYETDDIVGFRTVAEAEAVGREAHIDCLNEPLS